MGRVGGRWTKGLPDMSRAASQDEIISPRYATSTILLHWIVAALIVVVGGIGLAFGAVPRPARPFWLNLHTTIGVVMTLFIVARIGWRIFLTPPVFLAGEFRSLEVLSKGVHLLMYVLMGAVPATGLVAFIWHGRVFDFGAFVMDFAIVSTRAIYHPVQSIHTCLAYGLCATIAIHVLAALWHQFVLRDNLVGRMLVRPLWSARLDKHSISERSNHAL